MNNILDKLSSTSDAFPDKIAFAFIRKGNKKKTDSISFRELDQKSDRAARYLSNRGFKDGLVTLVLARPSTEFVVLMYAMLKTGAVPLLLPSIKIRKRSGRAQLRKILNRARPEGVIGSGALLAIRRILRLGPRKLRTINVRNLKKFYSNSNNGSGFTSKKEIDWTDVPAFVRYTTGSTGPPKGVIYSHGMLHSLLRTLESEGITSDDVFFGRSGTLIIHPLIGISSVSIMAKPRHIRGQEIVETVSTWGATAAFLSPPSAIHLANYLESHAESHNQSPAMLESLTRIYVGGETISAGFVSTIESHLSEERSPRGGFRLVYGATEGFPLCQAHASTIIETHPKTESGMGFCLGEPVEGIMIRILSFEDYNEQFDPSIASEVSGYGPGSIGEISAMGPAVYSSLIGQDEIEFGGPKTTAHDSLDGTNWHRTGDLGYLDQHGRVWIVGRKAHRVKSKNGYTLYTKQIEEIFNHSLGIRTALVEGPDNHWPVILVEKNNAPWNEMKKRLKEEAKRACGLLGYDGELTFLQYGGVFPVDSGHEAKIEREKLSNWAKHRLH
ncbi:MAG: AMP-binding protein [Candidatus Thermoplasmatota archaeon]|nr:AMP-binding protein [Candidatus Thalassarchaeaceae archaeon]MEC7365323.1 AMP-binding protein [Candidatus Thermoplasmatota archaeon]MEC7458081.1 AMP-binding protein [Candidatus Thermoplasmatota archaeon]